MSKCTCEHEDHFDTPAHPHETAMHVYGAEMLSTTKYKTPFGEFDVCDECRAEGHMGCVPV